MPKSRLFNEGNTSFNSICVFVAFPSVTHLFGYQSNYEGKDQELIQSSTTSDPENHM